MQGFKIVLICMLLLVLVSVYGLANDNSGTEVNVNINIGNNILTDIRSESLFAIGITTPLFGSAQTKYFGEEKYTTSLSGINLFLGYTKRNYFGKGLPGKGGAGYFEYGTVAILCPYIGIGYDYRFNDSFMVGIGLPDAFHFGFTF